MRKKIYWLSVALLALASCTQQKSGQSQQKELTLPVTELKLCRDWHVAFNEMIFEKEDEILPPEQYVLYDIDDDGRAEVLVRERNAYFVALLTYDKDGRLGFADCTTDGYIEFGVGKGWFVRRFDDHIGMNRTWTSYYYQAKDGAYEFIGHKTDGFMGIDDEEEPISFNEDGTDGKAPADSLITYYYDLTGWQDISPEALSTYMDHLDDWTDKPLTEPAGSSDGQDEAVSVNREQQPEEYHAYEFSLDNGIKGRMDLQVYSDESIIGWTTYYRSNGTRSKIKFFGSRYFDSLVANHFIELHEYHNGKSCGHFIFGMDDDDFQNGWWQLADKSANIASLVSAKYEADNEPAELASPATSKELTDQLLPCSRQAIRDCLMEEYPDLTGDIKFVLYDIDHNGTFEVLLSHQLGSAYTMSAIWTVDQRPQLLSGGDTQLTMMVNSPLLLVIPENHKEEAFPYIWRWKDGKPVMETLDENEADMLTQYSHYGEEVGQWQKL